MKLTVIGSSDAFGSGGKLQTCFHVAHATGEFLIDCGATSLVGLAREKIDPNRISHIFISHLHGDHFAGLGWWLIHAIHVAKRRSPLVVVGPAGIEARFTTLAETLFPGSSATPRPFELTFLEHEQAVPLAAGDVRVTPYEVSHPSGAPPYALRVEVEGKVIAFSGDTEWVDVLCTVAKGADLYISECSGFEAPVNYHINWRTLSGKLEKLGAKRVLLTHLGPEALANRAAMRHSLVTIADDGLTIEL